MKRRFTILMAAFTLLAFLAIPMGMMGQTTEITYTFSEHYTENTPLDGVAISLDNNISATFSKASGSTAPQYYTNGSSVRWYAKGNLEITASNATISNIEITYTRNDNTVSANAGSYSHPTGSSGTGIWSGSVTSVTFTQGGTSGHDRVSVIKVTYTTGGTPTPTTYTVIYDCNGGTNGCPENVTGIEAGEEITLANAPTKDGFDFDGWNDGNNTYDAGDEYTVNSNVTFTAQWTEVVSGDVHWVLTDLANLTSSDVFVIVGNNGSNYAMTNNNSTSSAPATSDVTIDGNEITSTVDANIKWTVSGDATNGYTFYPNGSTSTWLYCSTTASSSNNNNMRVGTGDRKVFEMNSNGYLMTKDTYTTRYLSIYDNADWRGYTNTNLCPQMSFYKKVTGDILPPSITANNVSIAYDATSGEIEYTLNNPTTDGNLSVSENEDWISNAVLNTTESKVTFTTTANEATTSREGIITITYTYGDNETITKDVAVTQAAAPVIYTTIPALFEAATSTATDVTVVFGGWVISAVHNSNAYLTDNQGHGLIIYGNELGFQVNDVLTGTASCKLQTYRGSAELTNLTNSTEGLTVVNNGTVTEQNIAISELSGVNTGALLAYQGLTYNGTALVDSDNNIITPYSTLYSYTFENGKTYNVKGIYQQYNSTKEILPRSADDIEEVEVQHEQYTLTVSSLSHVNLFIFGGEESETIISTEDGETTAQVYDGIEVLVSIDVEAGYVFQSLTITDGNGDPVVTVELTPNEYYSFLMPTSNVTITATAEVLTGDNYELFSGTLVEGDYLIVYDNGAMNNTVTGDRLQYETVTATNDVITTDNAAIVWHIAPSGDYWTIYSADADAYAASTGAKNKAQMLADGTDDKALWTVIGTETYEFVNKQNTTNEVNANLRKNGTYGFACYATSTGGALSLYKKVGDEPATETCTLTIDGYAEGNVGGYHLIASPVTVDPSTNGMTEGNFDLYYFNQAEQDEWRNWKEEDGGHFNLVPGTGYLYAKQATTDNDVFQFTLTGTPYEGDGTVMLTKMEGVDWSGLNLVGNPFNEIAYIDREFYTMNDDGSAIIPATNNSIQAMEGIFVYAETDDEAMQFSTEVPTETGEKIIMNVTRNRGNVIDRAIVSFGQGGVLPKFQLNPNNTKLYMTEGNQEFAVVRSANEGELPVSFKASENGNYTLNIETENVEVSYLHLIDNKTGVDTDLLATPSYTFEANTTDYANRFKLVFTTGSLTGSDTFAYFNGNEWVINNEGEATLQVVDVTGRVLSSEQINDSYNNSLNLSAGVYVLRLSNGNTVKTQKIVID